MSEYGVFSKISNEQMEFSKSERRISSAVLNDPEWAVSCSIGELAERCNVSNATVTRFCQKLGLDSFRTFRIELMRALSSIRADTETEDNWIDEHTDLADLTQKLENYYTQAITHTNESLDQRAVAQSCDWIAAADTVYLVGTGDMHAIVNTSFVQFLGVSDKFRCHPDIYYVKASVHNMNAKSVLIILAYTGELTPLLEVAQMARNCGAHVIVITGFIDSSLSALADSVLHCNIHKAGYQFSSIPILTAYRYVMDLLYVGYCQKLMKRKTVELEQIEYNEKQS